MSVVIFALASPAGLYFSSSHVPEKLNCGVSLSLALSLLVRLSFFVISCNFRLAEGCWQFVLGLSACKL